MSIHRSSRNPIVRPSTMFRIFDEMGEPILLIQQWAKKGHFFFNFIIWGALNRKKCGFVENNTNPFQNQNPPLVCVQPCDRAIGANCFTFLCILKSSMVKWVRMIGG